MVTLSTTLFPIVTKMMFATLLDSRLRHGLRRAGRKQAARGACVAGGHRAWRSPRVWRVKGPEWRSVATLAKVLLGVHLTFPYSLR